MACKLCGNPAFEIICEKCANESTKQDEIENLNPSTEVPVPEAGYLIDKDQVKFRWNENETSPEISQIKEKIIDAVERISFEEFQAALEKSAEAFNLKNQNDPSPYLVFFDYKAHASKYWTYNLIKEKINPPPQAARHFGPIFEKINGYQLLDKEITQGIKRFAVFDDAVYSGEQVLNRAIKPISEYFKQRGYGTPKIDLVIPYVTNQFLSAIEKIKENYDVEVTVIYQKIMATLEEIMTTDERIALENREGMLDKNSEEKTYLRSTLTYFDHRVADGHSFNEEVKKVAGNMPILKPYANESTQFYQQEEAEYEDYKRKIAP